MGNYSDQVCPQQWNSIVQMLKSRDYLSKQKCWRVIYPTLHKGDLAARAKKYMKGGNGALVGIEVKGGVEAGKKFIEALKMFYHVANIGDGSLATPCYNNT